MPGRCNGLLLVLWLTSCAPAAAPPAADARSAGVASPGAGGPKAPARGQPTADAAPPIEVPLAPAQLELARTSVASGLPNPRGMYVTPEGALLVAIAGTGDPANSATGGLWQLQDTNHDADFDDAGERTKLLDGQPSRNILDIVRRDEVFGMASIAAGGGEVLASLADFGGPSTILRIDGTKVSKWGSTHGNINSLAFDQRRGVWLGAASTTDEVLQLFSGGLSQRIVKFPALASGQDAVPAYLRYDARTGDVLVTLFSGSPEGEEGGQGTELVPRSASIVRVHAETRSIEPVVVGLTVPTDLEIDEDGSIYVLEFCDAFLDPVKTRQDMQGGAMHGGFRRFSGRLLHIDRATRQVRVVATGLDAPTNLTRVGGALYVAQGMGTPGRLIPGRDGKPVALQGFIERISLR
jgi:hypothetical protein